jgi:hypothetical protein
MSVIDSFQTLMIFALCFWCGWNHGRIDTLMRRRRGGR